MSCSSPHAGCSLQACSAVRLPPRCGILWFVLAPTGWHIAETRFACGLSRRTNARVGPNVVRAEHEIEGPRFGDTGLSIHGRIRLQNTKSRKRRNRSLLQQEVKGRFKSRSSAAHESPVCEMVRNTYGILNAAYQLHHRLFRLRFWRERRRSVRSDEPRPQGVKSGVHGPPSQPAVRQFQPRQSQLNPAVLRQNSDIIHQLHQLETKPIMLYACAHRSTEHISPLPRLQSSGFCVLGKPSFK